MATELLESFLALMPDAAVVVDGDGRIVAVNAQTSALFGYEQAELVGVDVERLVPERFRRRHRNHRRAYADASQPWNMAAGQNLTGRRADGTEVAIDISLAPLGVTDRPLVIAAIRDATERRAATALQAQLAAIVESSLDGIVTMRTDGIITSWNTERNACLATLRSGQHAPASRGSGRDHAHRRRPRRRHHHHLAGTQPSVGGGDDAQHTA